MINHANHQIRTPTEAYVCHHGRTADPGQRDHVPVLHVKLPAGDPDPVYYNPGGAYMRQLFPHYLVFLAALARLRWWRRVLVYISSWQAKWSSPEQQAVKDDRSPTYNLLMVVHNELTESRGEVAEMRGQRGDKMIAQAASHQAIR